MEPRLQATRQLSEISGRAVDEILMCCCGVGVEILFSLIVPHFLSRFARYQKLWKSYVKLRHLLANSPKVKQLDKQKLMQREVSNKNKHARVVKSSRVCDFSKIKIIPICFEGHCEKCDLQN